MGVSIAPVNVTLKSTRIELKKLAPDAVRITLSRPVMKIGITTAPMNAERKTPKVIIKRVKRAERSFGSKEPTLKEGLTDGTARKSAGGLHSLPSAKSVVNRSELGRGSLKEMGELGANFARFRVTALTKEKLTSREEFEKRLRRLAGLSLSKKFSLVPTPVILSFLTNAS